MLREAVGTYEETIAAGQRVRAFVPAPLPPKPAVHLNGPLQQNLESAVLALGRLDGVATLLPDAARFLYTYMRRKRCFPRRSREHSRRCPTSCSLSWAKYPARRS